MTWIDEQFKRAVGKHQVTSDRTRRYNCIAYAAKDDRRWWSYKVGYRWPAERSDKVFALVEVFKSLGYEKRDATETSLEDKYEKVAIYAKQGCWTHAARQLPSGKWTSKLGVDEDIEHDTPECLCGGGDAYGKIHCIMRKAKS